MRYLHFGGMPAIASLATTQVQHEAYLSSLYEAVVVRQGSYPPDVDGIRIVRDRLLLGIAGDSF